MSLQVWLPLNGDLNNYGLDGSLIVTADGVTADNAGKIGKCYSFNNTRIILQSESLRNIFKATTSCFSFAAWIYLNSDETDRVIVFGNYNANPFINWELSADCKQRLCAGGSSNYVGYGATSAVPKTTWTHIAVTYDGSGTKFYTNGVLTNSVSGVNTITGLVGSGTFWIGADARTGATRLKGKMNDFRVYDHALSAKEIEEIARGLVVHYKLDDRFCEATTNLITSITSGGQTTVNGDLVTTSGTNADTYFTLNLSENIVEGTEYTISCKAEMPANTNWIFPIGGQGNSTLQWTLTPGYNTYTFTANNFSFGTKRCFMDDLSGTARSSGISCKFYNWQLEKKDHATGFAGLGITRTASLIYDSSGYNHHAVPTGTIAVTNPSVRYDACTYFVNGSYLRSEERPAVFLPTDAITVNLWQKSTSWSQPISCTEGGGFNFENASSIRFPLYISGTGYIVATSGVAASVLNGFWHMITGTYDRQNVKIYIDGELKATAAVATPANISYANNYLFIGAEAGGNSTGAASSGYTGDISDVRIYATALSDDAIKELYHTSATIDNNGNVYAREVIEI